MIRRLLFPACSFATFLLVVTTGAIGKDVQDCNMKVCTTVGCVSSTSGPNPHCDAYVGWCSWDFCD